MTLWTYTEKAETVDLTPLSVGDGRPTLMRQTKKGVIKK